MNDRLPMITGICLQPNEHCVQGRARLQKQSDHHEWHRHLPSHRASLEETSSESASVATHLVTMALPGHCRAAPQTRTRAVSLRGAQQTRLCSSLARDEDAESGTGSLSQG